MKKEINTVHDRDLKDLLVSLEYWDKVLEGKVKCKFTNETITLDNLHSIFPESGDIKFVCNKPEAIKALNLYLIDHDL